MYSSHREIRQRPRCTPDITMRHCSRRLLTVDTESTPKTSQLYNIITSQYQCATLQDQEATATEVVTRKVRETDPTISDEKARSALGALGLIGEKAIRKVGHLSGRDTIIFLSPQLFRFNDFFSDSQSVLVHFDIFTFGWSR
jgi:hypothetical protein